MKSTSTRHEQNRREREFEGDRAAPGARLLNAGHRHGSHDGDRRRGAQRNRDGGQRFVAFAGDVSGRQSAGAERHNFRPLFGQCAGEHLWTFVVAHADHGNRADDRVGIDKVVKDVADVQRVQRSLPVFKVVCNGLSGSLGPVGEFTLNGEGKGANLEIRNRADHACGDEHHKEQQPSPQRERRGPFRHGVAVWRGAGGRSARI